MFRGEVVTKGQKDERPSIGKSPVSRHSNSDFNCVNPNPVNWRYN
jgi:hypothetical protein